MSRTAEILRSDLTYKVRNDIEKNNDRSNIEGTQVKTSHKISMYSLDKFVSNWVLLTPTLNREHMRWGE